MEDEFFDEAATRRVANRALASAALAFAGGTGGAIVPFPSVVSIPFLVIAMLVAVSAIRSLNHPEAKVIGGVRHLGIVLAAIGAAVAFLAIATRVFLLIRS